MADQCGYNVVKVGGVDTIRPRHRPGKNRPIVPGKPVATLQKAQALVQISPMIIMVAWAWDQHSPILGQAASWQTVDRPCSRTIAVVSW